MSLGLELRDTKMEKTGWSSLKGDIPSACLDKLNQFQMLIRLHMDISSGQLMRQDV